MLPEVTETSLSLSFDEQAIAEHSEQGYTNQQILPRPKLQAQQTKPQNQPRKQQQQDQENDHANFQNERSAGFAKGKEWFKQDRALQNSPSREPLKQILPPNQTHPKVRSPKQTQLRQKSHGEQRTPVEASNRRRNSPGCIVQGKSQATVSGHSRAQFKGDGSQTSVKGHNAFHEIDLRNGEPKQKTSNPTVRPSPQGSEGVDSRAFQNLPRQQMISSKQLGVENSGRQVDEQQLVRLIDDKSFPPHGNQVEKPFLETVLEEDSADGTLNKTMSETELELQITATSPVWSISKTDCESHGSTAGVIIDRNGETQHGYVQTHRRTEIRDEISFCPMDNEEHCGKKERLDNIQGVMSCSSSQQQSNGNEREEPNSREENNVLVYPEGTFQGKVGDGVVAKLTSAEGLTLPDPYQLLIRQEAQLRELQEQVLIGMILIQNMA